MEYERGDMRFMLIRRRDFVADIYVVVLIQEVPGSLSLFLSSLFLRVVEEES